MDALSDVVRAGAAVVRISEADRTEAMELLGELVAAFRGDAGSGGVKIVADQALSSGSMSVEFCARVDGEVPG